MGHQVGPVQQESKEVSVTSIHYLPTHLFTHTCTHIRMYKLTDVVGTTMECGAGLCLAPAGGVRTTRQGRTSYKLRIRSYRCSSGAQELLVQCVQCVQPVASCTVCVASDNIARV